MSTKQPNFSSLFIVFLSQKYTYHVCILINSSICILQMCAFRLLYVWRDNIAREEDESYG